MSVRYEDNSEEVLKELKKKKKIIHNIWGETIVGWALDDVPVGTPESTGIPGYVGGNLKQSLRHESDEEKTRAGSDVHYAPYVELGTSKMKAQPFLRPAVENHIKEYEKIAEDVLK